jgi:DNA-binding IclR family transcriptional regulator
MTETNPNQIEDSESSPTYTAPALEKGLDILELFADVDAGLTLSEISQRLGRGRNEIFRMVAVLTARNYLERDASDRFRMTDKLFRLGLTRGDFRHLVPTALPFMNVFADTTGHSCHVSAASSFQAVVIGRDDSTSYSGFTVRIGYRHSLFDSSAGYCLLAFMDPERRRSVVKLATMNGLSLDEADIERKVSKIVSDGGIAMPSSIAHGVVDISYPIFHPLVPRSAAVITCPYVKLVARRETQEAISERLKEVAGQISRELATTSSFTR